MTSYHLKKELFNKLKDKGLFWSYSKDISYDQIGDNILCETILKYAGFDDLKIAFDLFGSKYMKQVWLDKLVDDKRFIRSNLFIARIFFSMDVESSFFQEMKSARGEKLRLFAD